jgi:hypothetical protein
LAPRIRAFAAAHAEPLGVWLALRVGLTLLALLAGLELPGRPPGGTAPYQPPALPAVWDRLLGVWSRWDGQWYLQIASAGYRSGDGTTAFLPLYPWLVGALGALLGGRYLLAGVALSSLIFGGVLLLLYRLTREQYAPDLAPRAALYLAIFPTAFFFWAVYSEGLFLLLALGMFYAAGRGRWLVAGLCLAGALWTRPFGVVLIPCLLLELWLAWRGRAPAVPKPRPVEALAAVALPLLGGLLLLGWSAAALGDPLVFLSTQAEWNRAFSWPWDTVANGFRVALAVPFRYQEEDQSWFYLLTFLLFAALAVAGWARGLLRAPHALYLTLGLLFPLFSATPHNPLLSLPRFALVLFPAFLLLARAGRRPWAHYLILTVSLLLLALYTIRFANWFWVA